MNARSELLGNILAARRKELKLSLKAVLKRCERPCSAAYLQKLERGQVESPSPHILHDLSHALTIPYPTLMEAAGYVFPAGHEQPRPGSVVAALLEAEDLTPHERAALEAYLAQIAGLTREYRASEQGGEPEDFAALDQLAVADAAASVAHDYIHGLNGVTEQDADAAIWRIHDALRPLIDPTGETWRS